MESWNVKKSEISQNVYCTFIDKEPKIGDPYMNYKDVNSRVPQGILSNLFLFLMYISDIGDH